MYLDASHVYGLAASKKVPYNGFKLNTTTIEHDIRNSDEDGDSGYILKVVLESPKELHDLHKYEEFKRPE